MVEKALSLRQALHRLNAGDRREVINYGERFGSMIANIRDWADGSDPSQELGVNLADIRLLHLARDAHGYYDPVVTSCFIYERQIIKKAKAHLITCTWELEIRNINTKLQRGTDIRGRGGNRREIPLMESQRSRLIGKRDHLAKLLVE